MQHTRSILSVVVTSVDGQSWFLAQGHLRHEGHDVGKLLGGVLTYQPGLVSPHGVEVPQGDDVPSLKVDSPKE